MKNTLMILTAVLVFLGTSACKKRTEITYPATGLHGENALTLNQAEPDKEYSFAATLDKKAELMIVLTNTSPAGQGAPTPVWFYTSASGWSAGSYGDDGKQTFTSSLTGGIDLLIKFTGTGGSCTVDFYENGSSDVTLTKTLTW